MNFKRYQHIERFGTDEVLGEEIGICYVFPKIDGCFPYRSPVLLENGDIIDIGKIVNQNMDVKVMSYNFETGQIEPKRVIKGYKYSFNRENVNDEWVEFTVDRNRWKLISKQCRNSIMRTTVNHKIFVYENEKIIEKSAGDLKVGDLVLSPTTDLDKIQRQIILGGLLGDSSAFPNKRDKNNGITFNHGVSQKEYIEYKLSFFDKNAKLQDHVDGYVKDGQRYRGTTFINDSTNKIYELCYNNEKKTVNKQWLNSLNSFGLAIWYMDDGTLRNNKHAILSIEGFSLDEQGLIHNYMNKRGYSCKIQQSGDYNILRLDVRGSDNFFTDISSHIIPSMQYKIPESFRGRYSEIKRDFDGNKILTPRKILNITKGISSYATFNQGDFKYDIEVEDNHNYFCGGILVHNSNASCWLGDDGTLKGGSRRRELTLDNDNAGFYAYILEQENIKDYLEKHPTHRLFGEWLCLSGDTIIRKTSGGKNSNYMTLKEMYDYSQKKTKETYKWTTKDGVQKQKTSKRSESWWDRYGMPSIFSLYMDEDKIKPNQIQNIIYTGKKEVYKITTRKGYSIKATSNHPFYTPHGFVKLGDLRINDCVAVSDLSNKGRKKRSYGKGTNEILRIQKEYKEKIGHCERCGVTNCLELHHKDGNHENNSIDNYEILCHDCHKKETGNCFQGFEYNYEFDKIVSIEYVGIEDCYDISMCGTENTMNFVANGFIVHNCPHSLKTYRDDAWRKFYVFDVCIDKEEKLEYLPYEVYKPLLEEFDIEYLAPLRIIKNGDLDKFMYCTEINNFLIKDGQGTGEGIVIKNYDYYNKYGKQIWAKIVRNEFKERHHKEMGAPIINNTLIENKIIDKYVTQAFVEKEYEKIRTEKNGWTSKCIPILFSKVFYELINEEMWHILKEFKNPTINFKILNTLCINKIKEIKKEMFN